MILICGDLECLGYGVTDFACEIKFVAGGTSISIDINKGETETAKKYYLALVALSMEQAKHSIVLQTSLQTLQKVILNEGCQATVITDLVESLVKKHQPENYGAVFEAALLA